MNGVSSRQGQRGWTGWGQRRAVRSDASLAALAFDAGTLRGALLVVTLPVALAVLAVAAVPLAVGAWLAEVGAMASEEARAEEEREENARGYSTRNNYD